MIEVMRNSNYVSYEDERDGDTHVFTMVNLADESINDKYDYFSDYTLLYEEVYRFEENTYNVNALINDKGEYIRFIIETKYFERETNTDGTFVTSDKIILRPNKIKKHGDIYNSTLLDDKVRLEDYLKMNISFTNLDDEEFKSGVNLNTIIEDFLSTNKELKKQMKLIRTSSLK